jgi:small subunit ribosomal protein S2
MKPYIFTERNGVHIIDLQQTIVAISRYYEFIRESVGAGGTVLFVGTKRQAQETIAVEAQRCGMPYVNQRWLGGTLTNWRTIRQRIDYLLNLEARRDRGDFERLTKKEALGLQRQIEKLNNRLGGIREMRELPDLLFVVDVRRETTAVAEANKLDIPILAIVDTNCDPDPIDYIIPANDDAIRAIKLITSKIADAVLEGIALRKAYEPEEALEAEEITIEDEKYLSAATLARLKELTFEEQEASEGAPSAVEAPQAEEGETASEEMVESAEEMIEPVVEALSEPVELAEEDVPPAEPVEQQTEEDQSSVD